MVRYDACLKFVGNADSYAGEVLKVFLTRSKNAVVRIPAHFSSALIAEPGEAYAGWNCVRSPYPYLCVELEGGYNHEGHRCELFVFYCGKNMEHVETNQGEPAGLHFPWTVQGFALGLNPTDAKRLVAFPIISALFDATGDFHFDEVEGSEAWRPVDGVARNILDFLSTPSIRIEREPGMEKINRSRRKSGKPLLTDYHIINWSTQSEQTHSTGHGSTHRVRYDVRGNFATYTRGPLAGRRIWRPAHQRGLANDFYRPKGYQR